MLIGCSLLPKCYRSSPASTFFFFLRRDPLSRKWAFNTQNCRYCSDTNPKSKHQKKKNPAFTQGMGSFISLGVYWPILLWRSKRKRCYRAVYCHATELLCSIASGFRWFFNQRPWFQQDGAICQPPTTHWVQFAKFLDIK